MTVSAASKQGPNQGPGTKDFGQRLSTEDLEKLIAAGESELIEFKQEWYDLSLKEGKAAFVKDVLALGNTVRPEAPAYLLIGIHDDRRVLGVIDPPDAETVSHIIADYMDPPANVQCRDYEIDDKKVSVLVVSWSPTSPHHSIRDYPGLLSRNEVYVRRDRTIGVLTLTEIETRLREKAGRLGPLIGREPIQFGFVQTDAGRGSGIVVRVSNVTTEPVGGVDVMIDVRNARNPELFYRARKLGNATLQPGESREVELPMNEVQFYLATFDRATGERKWTNVSNLGAHMGDRWLDAILHVDYRDRDGFIRHLEQRVALDA